MVHRVLTLAPGRQTWLLMIWSISPYALPTRALLAFWWLPLSPHLCSSPWWLGARGTEVDCVMFQWIHLQWQMHTPSQISSGEVKIGKLMHHLLISFCKKNREVRVCTSMGLLLEVILQHKQNLKRYLGVYELAIIDESKQPVPPVWLRGESINRLMTIWTINLSGTLRWTINKNVSACGIWEGQTISVRKYHSLPAG